jgi:hypothetical protein
MTRPTTTTTMTQSSVLKPPLVELVLVVGTTVGVVAVAVSVGVGTPIENGLDVVPRLDGVVVAALARPGSARLSSAAAVARARRNYCPESKVCLTPLAI